MIAGMRGVVGFKFLEFSGKGTQVLGKIEDNFGNYITAFKSNHLGMGSFNLKPEVGKEYFGVISNSKGSL